MLRFEMDKKVYQLDVNPDDARGAVLTVFIPVFLQGEPQKVTIRYSWKKVSTIEVPNIPRWFNAMAVNAIKAKFDGIVRTSAKGPFEALKDWFERREWNQAMRK